MVGRLSIPNMGKYDSATQGPRSEHVTEAGREKMWEQPGQEDEEEDEDEEEAWKGSVFAVPEPRQRG